MCEKGGKKWLGVWFFQGNYSIWGGIVMTVYAQLKTKEEAIFFLYIGGRQVAFKILDCERETLKEYEGIVSVFRSCNHDLFFKVVKFQYPLP